MIQFEIDRYWTVSCAVDSVEYPACVPGVVHQDMLNNKMIKDPFYRTHEAGQQWIGESDWIYRTIIKVDKNILDHDRVELQFKGLDTYCDVRLNGQLILSADNMFRSWQVDVKQTLNPGENQLELYFHSPVKKSLPVKQQQDIPLPAIVEQAPPEKMISMLSRKAQYHFGWDWAPRMITCGIWRPVILQAWNQAVFRNVHIRQIEVNENAAVCQAVVEIETAGAQNLSLQLNVQDRSVAAETVSLQPGRQQVTLDFEIHNPQLWYPRELGEPCLYIFTLQMYSREELLCEETCKTGLRRVEMVREPDKHGVSFYFRINGIPVFSKGANYIPMDCLLTRVKPDDYDRLLESVAEAHMNMIRVWGGGIYEDDYFYQRCDELGLMVWQDFMFACALYPGNPEFMQSVAEEAAENIKRLRRHPSLVLWCGNNEIRHFLLDENMWRPYLEHTEITEAYEYLFHELLPQAVCKYDPDTPYWPSSPQADFSGGVQTPGKGDMHYWGVWHNKEEFDNYLLPQNTPRFMSEYGFQSFPAIDSVQRYAEPEDYDIESAVMRCHQRHPDGNRLMRHYMLRDYREPKDFESFLYVSQIVQADAMKTAAEHHRRSRPLNMGTLYWQLNDCWPVASWAGIDYYGDWKALHYFAKKFFAPVMASPVEQADQIEIFTLSDRLNTMEAQLMVNVMELNGGVRFSDSISVKIPASSSTCCYSRATAELLNGAERTNALLQTVLMRNDQIIGSNVLYFCKIRDLRLKVPDLKLQTNFADNRVVIQLESDTLAKNVYLRFPGAIGRFSDNYFDCLPGQKQCVYYTAADGEPLPDLNHLQVRTLADAYR